MKLKNPKVDVEQLENRRHEEILKYYDEIQRDALLWEANITKINENLYQAKAMILAEYCGTEGTEAFDPSLISFHESIDNFKFAEDEIFEDVENIAFDVHFTDFYDNELESEVAEIIGEWLVDILNDEWLDDSPEYRGVIKDKIKDPIIKKCLGYVKDEMDKVWEE